MRLDAMRQPVGCLLLGDTVRMRTLAERLAARNVAAVHAGFGDNLLTAAQEGLYAARRSGGACVAADGEFWAAALALSAQLSVERVVLMAPTDRIGNAKDDLEKQIERLKAYACRNLFFCVSDVLVLEGESDPRSARRIDQLCRRLCNARVQRASLSDQRWTNCEQSPIEAAAGFLKDGVFAFSLAK